LTGFEFAAAYARDDHVPPRAANQLFELRVTAFGGFAAPTTGLHVIRGCATCEAYTFEVRVRLADLIDAAKLDGSDLFSVWPYPLIRVASDRFCDAVMRDGLTGLRFVHLEDFELTSTTASPGLPTQWLTRSGLERLSRDADYRQTVEGGINVVRHT
jgi:hypothetical protein